MPLATCAPTTEPAEVPTMRSAVDRSAPASARPASIPNSQTIPVTPPPPRANALPIAPLLPRSPASGASRYSARYATGISRLAGSIGSWSSTSANCRWSAATRPLTWSTPWRGDRQAPERCRTTTWSKPPRRTARRRRGESRGCGVAPRPAHGAGGAQRGTRGPRGAASGAPRGDRRRAARGPGERCRTGAAPWPVGGDRRAIGARVRPGGYGPGAARGRDDAGVAGARPGGGRGARRVAYGRPDPPAPLPARGRRLRLGLPRPQPQRPAPVVPDGRLRNAGEGAPPHRAAAGGAIHAMICYP